MIPSVTIAIRPSIHGLSIPFRSICRLHNIIVWGMHFKVALPIALLCTRPGVVVRVGNVLLCVFAQPQPLFRCTFG